MAVAVAVCFDCDRRIGRGSATLPWRTLIGDEPVCDERITAPFGHRSVQEAVRAERTAQPAGA